MNNETRKANELNRDLTFIEYVVWAFSQNENTYQYSNNQSI